MESKKICILGAGLSGLSHALARQEAGDEVTVIDRQPQVGGVLQSNKIDGYLLDYSANTLSLRSKKTADFLRKYNILEHAIDANLECSKRFIVKQNKIVSLPQGFISFFTSSFLSTKGKLRLCMEPFLPRLKNNREDESMGAFVKRRLGQEALDYAANPFIGGIYASRPESLILKHAFPNLWQLEEKYGSILKGMVKGGINKEDKLPKTRLISFKNGMHELPQRLGNHLQCELLLSCNILEVKRESNGLWTLLGESKHKGRIEKKFDAVICALPSHCLPKIKWNALIEDHLIHVLAEATHPPLALTFLGYKKEQISHPLDGFGFLVPEVEKRKILGTLFSSTLFSNRAPKRKALLTSFVGGERKPELCRLPDDDLISLAESENRELLGIKGKPEFTHLVRWPRSIPLPDHSTNKRLEAASLLSQKNFGLSFSGSHISGAPLPNCLSVA